MSTAMTETTTIATAAEARAALAEAEGRRRELAHAAGRVGGELADRRRWMFNTIVNSPPHRAHAAAAARLAAEAAEIDAALAALTARERAARVVLTLERVARDRDEVARLEAAYAARVAALARLLAPVLDYEGLPADFVPPVGRTAALAQELESARRALWVGKAELRRVQATGGAG